MTKLSAKNLAKSYKLKKVVKNVSLEVNTGEIVGLLGPNGAGKTTTFYMVVGLVKSDAGTVFIDSKNLTFAPMHMRARFGIGYLPQEASIFKKLSVKDNIMAILEMNNSLNKLQKQKNLDNLLDEFNIGHIRDSLGMSLSGGERRRVEIARALASNPAFILLDEPFAGVDPISVGDIKNIIKHLASRKLGVLITDHNVRETLDVCSRSYIVSHGSLIAKGSPNEILADKKVRDVYLGQQFKL